MRRLEDVKCFVLPIGMRRLEDVKCIDEAYETHAVTGRWRLVIQIVSGKQITYFQLVHVCA